MVFGTREIVYLIILVILIIISAFFSGSETALMRSRRFRIRHLAEQGNAEARQVEKILKEPDQLISTILLGNNFVNVLGSAIATALFISLFGASGILYATLVMTIILLIFAEITPKTIAAYRAEEVSMLVSYPIRAAIKLLNPFARVLSMISKWLVSLMGIEMEKAYIITEEDVGSAISIGHKGGFIQESKARMLIAILDLDSISVKKVMLPLNEITFISKDSSFDDIVTTIKTQSYSRYPVYEGSQDNILGYLHIRDIWAYIDNRKDFQIDKLLRETDFVPETKTALTQLYDFQQKRLHMAFVVDEYGSVKGAITLEDIIEEITGDIIDEHDVIYDPVVPVGTNSYLVRGNISLRDLGRYIEKDFPEELDTLTGLIYELLDRIPEEGDTLAWEDMQFKVERMRGNRISRVRIMVQK